MPALVALKQFGDVAAVDPQPAVQLPCSTTQTTFINRPAETQ